MAVGETVPENDLIVAALARLPSMCSVIKTIIMARESSITLKAFRAQLLSTKKTTKESQSSMQVEFRA